MALKPKTISGYSASQTELVRACALYVATRLGDLMDDLVIIGGLVPPLLIDQDALPSGAERHPGTMDLDLGLKLALLDEGKYRALTARLRDANFSPDRNENGNPTNQRWKVATPGGTVMVDFLMEPTSPNDTKQRLINLEKDFAAIIAPGLRLAFQDRRKVSLSGKTILGAKATREVWVCGAGAYTVLKALAFSGRGHHKDAFDLYYVVRNFGAGAKDVFAALRPILGEPEARTALDILRRDFLEHDGLGPHGVAMFVAGEPDDNIQADVVGIIRQLMDEVERIES